MKKIFLYVKDKNKKAAAERICETQQIALHALSAADLNRTVASVCGVTMKNGGTHETAPPLYVMPETLLFYGLDDAALDRFLEAWKESGAEKIVRKAVITPFNLSLTLYELIEHLGRESAEMG
ncbi:MAG: DUF3783 domain-containing protein [Lachnospiraceae bacterium]|nr:DUF3783 domain-containing protein [Lachnospiraceae bacterium]